MSAPAPSPQRHPTRGYAEIPNSLIENQSILTPAELSLALIVARRGGLEDGATISTATWEKWTGLSARSLEYAAAGLQHKGGKNLGPLQIEGRGERAVYRFSRHKWDNLVRISSRDQTPRTIGRSKAVSPKPGAKVHRRCREEGCAMLTAADAQQLHKLYDLPPPDCWLSLVPSTLIAQPVARLSVPSIQKQADISPPPEKDLKPIVVTPIAQPVARLSEKSWPATFEALRSAFPCVGSAFLSRLVAMAQDLYADTKDAELAQAVTAAFRKKRKVQQSEGLFLLTVPEVLAAIRKRPTPDPAPAIGASISDMLTGVAAALRARGEPLARHAADIDALNQPRDGLYSAEELEHLDVAFDSLQAEINETAASYLTAEQRADIAASVETQTSQYVNKMSREQLDSLTSRIRDDQTLQLLGLPRLGLFER